LEGDRPRLEVLACGGSRFAALRVSGSEDPAGQSHLCSPWMRDPTLTVALRLRHSRDVRRTARDSKSPRRMRSRSWSVMSADLTRRLIPLETASRAEQIGICEGAGLVKRVADARGQGGWSSLKFVFSVHRFRTRVSCCVRARLPGICPPRGHGAVCTSVPIRLSKALRSRLPRVASKIAIVPERTATANVMPMVHPVTRGCVLSSAVRSCHKTDEGDHAKGRGELPEHRCGSSVHRGIPRPSRPSRAVPIALLVFVDWVGVPTRG
jgi:hypothetical protein